MISESYSFFKVMSDLISEQTPFVLVTLVETRGSAPQVVGAKALIGLDGLIHGTVGGGKVEAQAILHSKNLLQQNGKKLCDFVKWNLQKDIKMTCGGEVKFFFEVFFSNEWEIAIFGAGHIAQSIIPTLLTLNCKIKCIDQREEWLERLPNNPRLKKIKSLELKDEVKSLNKNCFILLMSQGHATDLPVLEEVLKTRVAPYLGVIGSKQKAMVLKNDLKQKDFSKEKIESFFCPMGLTLGNNTPAEISISIISQLLLIRDKGVEPIV